MKKETINKDVLLAAYNAGYRITKEGKITNPIGEVLNGYIKDKTVPTQYIAFSFRKDGMKKRVLVHQLQAYQKFGDALFNCDTIRHLDGNSFNNSFDNIELGSYSDNWMDIPEVIRYNASVIGANTIKIKNQKEILAFYYETKSYKKTMEKFGISKGSVYNIIHSI